jgi:hypothetical protein
VLTLLLLNPQQQTSRDRLGVQLLKLAWLLLLLLLKSRGGISHQQQQQ